MWEDGLLPPSYRGRTGSSRDRALLVQFMQQTYQEWQPNQNHDHLVATVEQFFSEQTPLWLVEVVDPTPVAIACLWLGSAIDQLRGDRYTCVFLLYVAPAHRRQGIGYTLMRQAEQWAKRRGDRQIGLQVFSFNQVALALYQRLGYQTQSVALIKPLTAD